MMAALKQPRYAPLTDGETALVLFAVSEGFAKNVELARMAEFVKELIKEFKDRKQATMAMLNRGDKLDDRQKEELKAEIDEFAKRFVYGRTA